MLHLFPALPGPHLCCAWLASGGTIPRDSAQDVPERANSGEDVVCCGGPLAHHLSFQSTLHSLSPVCVLSCLFSCLTALPAHSALPELQTSTPRRPTPPSPLPPLPLLTRRPGRWPQSSPARGVRHLPPVRVHASSSRAARPPSLRRDQRPRRTPTTYAPGLTVRGLRSTWPRSLPRVSPQPQPRTPPRSLWLRAGLWSSTWRATVRKTRCCKAPACRRPGLHRFLSRAPPPQRLLLPAGLLLSKVCLYTTTTTTSIVIVIIIIIIFISDGEARPGTLSCLCAPTRSSPRRRRRSKPRPAPTPAFRLPAHASRPPKQTAPKRASSRLHRSGA